MSNDQISSDLKSRLVTRAAMSGYLITPEALSFLTSRENAVELLDTIIRNSKLSANRKVISLQDIEAFSNVTKKEEDRIEPVVEVLFDPTNKISPAEPTSGYQRLFTDRYAKLVKLFRNRPDSKGLVNINSIGKTQGKKFKIAGLVLSKKEKGNSIELSLDDPTGSIRLICKEAMVKQMMKVPLDAAVMLEITHTTEGQFLVERISLPDLPIGPVQTHGSQVFAVLLSDLHIGSNMFLHGAFKRFLSWLAGNCDDSDLVKRIKYVVIAGDLIDGIGIYPEQERQLAIRDPSIQYTTAAELLRSIPSHLRIIISPGNHDMVRQALPQPTIPMRFASQIYNMENVTLVGNPAYVKLHGVTFLVYHGRSLDDIIASTPEMSYRRPTEAMKIMLATRHLAPIYGMRTVLAPEQEDMLVIETVPDVLHCGHVHVLDYQTYKGVLMINSGTFQGITEFQRNMGLEPTPALVPILDLSDLSVTIKNFGEYQSAK